MIQRASKNFAVNVAGKPGHRFRGLTATALVVLPLAAVPPANAAETVPLITAIDHLPVGTESREGYHPPPLQAASHPPHSLLAEAFG